MFKSLVALTAQYLNVRQRKLVTTVQVQHYYSDCSAHILQHDSADKGSQPMEYFFKHNPNYFQITQPGRSTVTPQYK
jgi:hypothetical protein